MEKRFDGVCFNNAETLKETSVLMRYSNIYGCTTRQRAVSGLGVQNET